MPSKVTIYHNPRCSKSRQTLVLLEEKGCALEVVEYLKDVPSKAKLKAIFAAYPGDRGDLVRRKEAAFGEAKLSKDSSVEQLIDAIRAHPILLERPIVVAGDRVAIGRPPESVLEII